MDMFFSIFAALLACFLCLSWALILITPIFIAFLFPVTTLLLISNLKTPDKNPPKEEQKFSTLDFKPRQLPENPNYQETQEDVSKELRL